MFEDAVTLVSGTQVKQRQIGDYTADFYEGNRQLVVTFENGDDRIDRRDRLRDPLGLPYLGTLGYSVLGIKAPGVNCYQGKFFVPWMSSPEMRDFLAGYDRCIFVGASMGSLPALAFSIMRPGSMVIGFSPMSTLDPEVVPHERQWQKHYKIDWTGPFADGAKAAALASRIYAAYDPAVKFDRMQVERIDGPNVIHLKMPGSGHGAMKGLLNLGVFHQVLQQALAETLTAEGFSALVMAGVERWYARNPDRPKFYGA